MPGIERPPFTQSRVALAMDNAVVTNHLPISRVTCQDPSGFIDIATAERKPLIVSGLVPTWPAYEKWSLNYFEQTFGELPFNASTNLPTTGAPFQSAWRHHRQTMTIKEFVRYMESASKPCYITRQYIERFPGAIDDVNFNFLPQEHDFSSETFLWIGSAGTRSGLHFDFQDNFLCQIRGTKSVVVISPEDSKYLYPYKDSITKSRVVPEEPNLEKYPNFSNSTVFEGLIAPGDALFIPKHWWHSVVSVEPFISLSHNYGQKVSFMELLRAVNAGGFAHWLTVGKDFLWYGALSRNYETRLFDDPPFGRLLYTIFLSALKRRMFVG